MEILSYKQLLTSHQRKMRERNLTSFAEQQRCGVFYGETLFYPVYLELITCID